MIETFLCSHCGRPHPISARYEMDGSSLCPDCLEEHTVICSHCGQRIWSSDNAGDGNRYLCQDCCDAYYLYCAQCGCLLSIDEAYIDDDNDYVCADCYHRAQNSQAIHNYNYKPAPIFYGTGDRYFGVELEIDRGGEDSDAARALLSIANAEEELLYCKHDGSLNDGFELVTHPLTFQYHIESCPGRIFFRRQSLWGTAAIREVPAACMSTSTARPLEKRSMSRNLPSPVSSTLWKNIGRNC